MRRAAPGDDPLVLARRLTDPLTGPAALARLIDEVTVKETYFLRDPAELASIDWPALAARAAARGGAPRAWSAACATGEEAYTLAMLARDALGGEAARLRVLGTDISEAALAHAGAARYRPRAAAALPAPLRARHLRPDGAGVRVAAGVRAAVTLRRHNLTRDGAPPPGEDPFDLVVCRNVLIYFDEATAARVAGELRRALHPGGVLVLGAADGLHAARGAGEAAPPRPARPPRRPSSPPPAPAPPGPAAEAAAALARDPLDPDAWLVRGLAHLEAGEARQAVPALRRALLLRPGFPVAAFQLGRAHEGCADAGAARRAYGQALRALADAGDDDLPVGAADLAAACRARLTALG